MTGTLFLTVALLAGGVTPATADHPSAQAQVEVPAISSLQETRPAAVRIELPPRLPREGHTLRSALVISGIYAGSFAIMWNLPEETTNWEKEDMGERFLDAFTRTPVWDDDEFVTNWVLHPWWGMWVYQSERNYGESMLRSFTVATLHSLFFEYVVEAWTESPSMQDLISTSPIGALAGELVHRWIKRMGRDGFSRGERILIDLLNPAYRWQIGFDRPVR